MEAILDEDKVFRVSGANDAAAFFCNLNKLLPQPNYILGIACFTPAEKIGRWLQRQPVLAIPRRYNYRHLTKVLSENKWGGAYYLSPTSQNLTTLTQFAAEIENPSLLCSHVIGFKGNEALFSFHDAFEGDDLLVSSKISLELLNQFCHASGLEYRLTDNPQQRGGWRWKQK